MKRTIFEKLEEVSNCNANDIAIICNNNNITFKELINRINLLARSFMEIGVNENSVINIKTVDKLDIIYSIFASNKIGASLNFIKDKDDIKDGILIIDSFYYNVIQKDLINYNLNKIVVIDGDSNNDNIISWNDFILLSKYYNKTIKRSFNSKIELFNNYYICDSNKICINLTEEILDNIINNNEYIDLLNKDKISNMCDLTTYKGFIFGTIIPLLNNCSIDLSNNSSTIICDSELLFNLIKKQDEIIKKNKYIIFEDIYDEYETEVINNYFENNKITSIYRLFTLLETNNIISINGVINKDIIIKDCITKKKLVDNSIGIICIKDDCICNQYNNSRKDSYIESNYAGKIIDNKLFVIDTKIKETIRCEMNKTGLPSKDMPWTKYYPEESKYDKVLEYTLYENLIYANKDNYLETALIYLNREIKFYELFNNIEITAKSLYGLGVRKGDYVTLCMPNIPEFLYIFYAINKIGGIACLIEPRTNAIRIKGYLEESHSKYLFMVDLCKKNIDKIVDMDGLKRVISISPMESVKDKKIKRVYNLTHKKVKSQGKYLDWKEFIEIGNSFGNIEANHYEKRQTATIVYTSGTTGRPKGAELPNETYNGQNMQLKYSGICPKIGEKFLGNIPFFSAYGSSSGMHNALSSGVTIHLIPSYKPTDFPKLLYKYRPTHVMGVPRFYEILADSKVFNKTSLEFLHNPVSGGDKMTPNREHFVNDYLLSVGGVKLKKGLGMSEYGGGFITTVNEEVNKIGSVGIPHVGNNVKIVDPVTKEEVKYGREHNIGELYVTGPTQMNGYLNNEEETNKFYEVDENGVRWAKTGDLVYMDEDGVVFFSSRIKNVIMRPDGHTVPLLPIENAIDKSKYVESCAVVGANVDNKKTGKRPMAYIVLKQDRDKSFNEIHSEILALVDAGVPLREQPAWYRYVDRLPYNLAGKVDVKKLEDLGDNDNSKNLVCVNLEKNSDKK